MGIRLGGDVIVGGGVTLRRGLAAASGPRSGPYGDHLGLGGPTVEQVCGGTSGSRGSGDEGLGAGGTVASPLQHGRAGGLRQEVERLRLARNSGGADKSCLADRCYAESCLVGRCYARQISRSLHSWTDERRAMAPLGVVVALTDDWTGKDDADLFPEDGSVVRG
ncbi:Arginyl-tRNA synthetase [Hordeum vulgare]|nr:Arginyl-tRNA synthetase [Hordeum vulgare]